MTHVEIKVAAAWPDEFVAGVIERVMSDLGLSRSMKGTLRTYPGCVHWHYKKGTRAGTIEVTSWPGECRVWISVRSGRAADWIDASLRRISAELESRLAPDARGRN